MAEHILAQGKGLIAALRRLGAALRYHVEVEFPVDEAVRGEAPAVDVAWFREKGHVYPLMIFEVESGAGNSIANNPLKIYSRPNKEIPDLSHLQSYLGFNWVITLVFAAMAGTAATADNAAHWSNRIIEWQENSGHLPMIGANFGLSQDYDEFLVGFSGTLIAGILALSRGHPLLVREFSPLIENILGKLRPGWWRLQLAAWLAHIGARFGVDEWFNFARDIINTEGGMPQSRLLGPPGYAGGQEAEYGDLYEGDKSLCPDAPALRLQMATASQTNTQLWTLCCRLLTDAEFECECGNEIARALWAGADEKS